MTAVSVKLLPVTLGAPPAEIGLLALLHFVFIRTRHAQTDARRQRAVDTRALSVAGAIAGGSGKRPRFVPSSVSYCPVQERLRIRSKPLVEKIQLAR
jgi:hypothetical protein